MNFEMWVRTARVAGAADIADDLADRNIAACALPRIDQRTTRRVRGVIPRVTLAATKQALTASARLWPRSTCPPRSKGS